MKNEESFNISNKKEQKSKKEENKDKPSMQKQESNQEEKKEKNIKRRIGITNLNLTEVAANESNSEDKKTPSSSLNKVTPLRQIPGGLLGLSMLNHHQSPMGISPFAPTILQQNVFINSSSPSQQYNGVSLSSPTPPLFSLTPNLVLMSPSFMPNSNVAAAALAAQ